MHRPEENNLSARRLAGLLAVHPLFGGNKEIVKRAAQCAELIQLGLEDVVIGSGREDRDLYLIFSGSVDVLVNGEEVARRGEGQTVGELELISPDVRRVATVVARELTVVGRLAEPDFTDLADEFPVLWRRLAGELVQRLIA